MSKLAQPGTKGLIRINWVKEGGGFSPDGLPGGNKAEGGNKRGGGERERYGGERPLSAARHTSKRNEASLRVTGYLAILASWRKTSLASREKRRFGIKFRASCFRALTAPRTPIHARPVCLHDISRPRQICVFSRTEYSLTKDKNPMTMVPEGLGFDQRWKASSCLLSM
eukprot:1393127-Amorphochlora_amoeboformis.AAC.1